MRSCVKGMLIAACMSLPPLAPQVTAQQSAVNSSFGQSQEFRPSIHAFAMVGYGFTSTGAEIPANPTLSLEQQKVHTQSQTINSSGIKTEVQDQYINYGQGLKTEIGAEMELMEKLAAELSFEYTAGVPFLSVKYENQDALNPLSWEEKYRKHAFGLKAMVKPHLMVLDLLDMYCGVGIGLFFTKCTYTNSDVDLGKQDGYFKTRPGLGLLGQFGAYYPVHDLLDIKAELAFEQVSFSLKELRPTDGNYIYHFERNSTAGNEFQPVKIPGSNLALRIGVRYKIL
jgi:opacity protein-like surface antigen